MQVMGELAARAVSLPSPQQRLGRLLRGTVFDPIVASIWAVFAAWLALTLVLPAEVLPPPQKVWSELVKSFQSGIILENTTMSLYRIWAGWAAGMVVAIVLGVLMGSKGLLNVVLRDYVLVFMSMPLLVWVLLGVLWFGGDITASIVAIALVAGPQGSVNIYEGVCNVDKEMIDMARVYRVPTRDILFRIMIPSMMPFIMATARQAFAQAWKAISLLEVFGASLGIGWQIEASFDRMSVAGVLSWVVIFMCVMLVIETIIFGQAERYIFRWRPAIGDVK
jgi:NitT/TauT family transport system permease protein